MTWRTHAEGMAFALTVLFAGSVAAVNGSPVAAAAEVSTTEVCFEVHHLGEPHVVRGTLHATPEFTAESTALLLLHGAVADRHAWDGGGPNVEGAPSVANLLAQDGWGVFAIDRLGYGDSPYGGSGVDLTGDGYIEMTREVIAQISDGSFTVAGDDGACPGSEASHGAANVVLSGFSQGVALTMAFATRHHDIAGIIPMGVTNQPEISSALQALFFDTIVPQVEEGLDFISFWDPDDPEAAETCVASLFYEEGMNPDAMEQLCGPEYYLDGRHLDPVGVGILAELIVPNLGDVGPTPVLLVFHDRDAFFPIARTTAPNRMSGRRRSRCGSKAATATSPCTSSPTPATWGFSTSPHHS